MASFYGFYYLSSQLKVGHHWLVIRKVYFLDAMVVQLGHFGVAFPQDAVAVGWHPLLFTCVIHLCSCVILVGWLEADLSLLELPKEHVLKSALHWDFFVHFKFSKCEK